MKNKEYIYILGAGASHEVNLPLGNQLRSEIAKCLDIRYGNGGFTKISGSDLIDLAYRNIIKKQNVTTDINPHIYAGWHIRDAMTQAASIDNFLDAHKDNTLISTVGKLAIAECILNAERNSLLFEEQNSTIDISSYFSKIEATWFSSFFRAIIAGSQLSNISKQLSRIAIISFNYDRCIEYFLHQALKNYYKIGNEQIIEITEQLTILHPYGSLGALTWPHRYPSIEFGGKPRSDQLIEISKEIKTFTEGTNKKDSQINEIRLIINNAQTITFLGFAYHKQNLELLFGNKLKSTSPNSTKIFGTAKGLSDSDVKIITEELVQFRNYHLSNININNKLTCSTLFNEYARSISIG